MRSAKRPPPIGSHSGRTETRKKRKTIAETTFPQECHCSIYAGYPHQVKNRYEAYRHFRREAMIRNSTNIPPSEDDDVNLVPDHESPGSTAEPQDAIDSQSSEGTLRHVSDQPEGCLTHPPCEKSPDDECLDSDIDGNEEHTSARDIRRYNYACLQVDGYLAPQAEEELRRDYPEDFDPPAPPNNTNNDYGAHAESHEPEDPGLKLSINQKFLLELSQSFPYGQTSNHTPPKEVQDSLAYL